MIDSILATIADEFHDFAEAEEFARAAFRLTVAVLLAAVVGYERERSGSTAGLRTHMLVALGTCLLVVSASQSGVERADLTRVLQGIFAGIGFLGAGAILKHTDTAQIRGLTTAASIWVTAAIATAVGLGQGATAVFATAIVYIILSVLRRLEARMETPEDEKQGPVNGP